MNTLSYQIDQLADGAYRVALIPNGTEVVIRRDQFQALCQWLIQREQLGAGLGLSGVAAPLANACGGLILQVQSSDLQGVVGSYGQVSTFVNQALLLRSYRDPDEDTVPQEEWLTESVHSGVQILGRYPVETASVEVDRRELEQSGERLGAWYSLRRILDVSTALVVRNIAPVSRFSAAAVKQIGEATAPFLPRNLDLVRISQPIIRYMRDSVERGLATKRLVSRVEQRTAERVEAELGAKAREAARKEVGGQFLDQIKVLLGAGNNKA